MDTTQAQMPVASMPRTRAECVAGPRPCPYTQCRHHLAADRRRYHRGRSGPALATGETCCLDIAGRGGATLEETGHALGVTRERIRQIEKAALRHLAGKLVRRGLIARHEVRAALAAVRAVVTAMRV